MIKSMSITAGRRALTALVLVSSVGLLAACSSSVVAPQDMTGAAPLAKTTKTAKTVRVGDDPAGCTPFGTGTNLAHGFTCVYNDAQAATITVPSNVTGMQVALAGGQGGNSNPASGGYGTAVTGTWTVSGGQTLTITVGQGASDNTPGGGAAAGGSPGGSDAGAGGGASAVEIDGRVVAVASGGGGGGAQGMFPGTDDGGAGGTSTVNNGNGHGGSGPGSGDGHSGGNGPALAAGTKGGAGGAAGGSYVSSDSQATSMQQANGGGDGEVTITWL